MNANRKTAIIVGCLFILATVSSILGTFGFIDPIMKDLNYLSNIYSSKTVFTFGILIDSINSAAVIAIAVMLYPVFRKQNKALAMGYVSSRIIESVVLITGSIGLLLMIALSKEFVLAGSPDNSQFQILGSLFLALNNLIFVIGPGIIFGSTALILNILLYKSKLVPRLISVWGFIAGLLLISADFSVLFGLSTSSTIFTLLVLPIGLNEMALAIWLIVKGFNFQSINKGESK